MTAPHESAFAELVAALTDSAAYVEQHPFYADAENQASGYAFLVSMLLSRLEERVVFDTEQPYFRILDPRIREGGDNPDQRYLIARLVGGEVPRPAAHPASGHTAERARIHRREQRVR